MKKIIIALNIFFFASLISTVMSLLTFCYIVYINKIYRTELHQTIYGQAAVFYILILGLCVCLPLSIVIRIFTNKIYLIIGLWLLYSFFYVEMVLDQMPKLFHLKCILYNIVYYTIIYYVIVFVSNRSNLKTD